MTAIGPPQRPFRDTSIRRKLMVLVFVTCGAVVFSAALTLAVLQPVSSRRDLGRGLAVLGFAWIAGLGLAFVLVSRLRETIFRPLQRLVDAVAEVSTAKDYAVRVEVTSDDELGALATGFNAMLAAIQARDAELKRVYEFTRSILDSMSDPVSIIRADDFTIADANAAFLKLAGARRDDVVGKHYRDVLFGRSAPGGGEAGRGLLADMVETGIFVPVEFMHERGGDRRIAEVSHSPVRDAQGKITQLVRVERDITDRKRTEQALRETHRKLAVSVGELRQINDEIKNLAYIVSHDLRAPLVSIKGFSGELQAAIDALRPLLAKCGKALNELDRARLEAIFRDDVGEALRFIDSSAQRMDKLISSILNLSRLGQRELKLGPVDMNQVTGAVLAAVAHQLEEKQVKVTVADLPEAIADPFSMEQIMGNLVDNALKYLEPGRPGELEVSAEGTADTVTFHVRDNGRGIAKEDRERVFDLFRRAGKQDVPGEGMGLAYVKTLIRRHRGRIWCWSAPGVGSTFSFSIPTDPSVDDDPSADAPAEA